MTVKKITLVRHCFLRWYYPDQVPRVLSQAACQKQAGHPYSSHTNIAKAMGFVKCADPAELQDCPESYIWNFLLQLSYYDWLSGGTVYPSGCPRFGIA